MLQTLPGLGHLPARSVYCIGRNYAEHARELNNEIPDNPVVFMKPPTSLLEDKGTVIIPAYCTELHHEAELVIAIGKTARNIARTEAFDHVAGYAIGIDITARDVQTQLKNKGQPWLLAKGLDTFSPLGEFVTPDKVSDTGNIRIELTVNSETRQDGNTSDMLFTIDDIISRLSFFFTLLPGDLIFTGTPAGVGPIRHGDEVNAAIYDGVTSNKLSSVNVLVKHDKQVQY